MKVKETNCNAKPLFNPITISITFETLAELQEMWHRTNVCVSDALEHSNKEPYAPTDEERYDGVHDLWKAIDDKLKEVVLCR